MPTTKYLWDEANDSYLAETDETDALTAAYTVEPAHFGRVVSEFKDEETSYHHHYDALGSTRQLTDQSGDVTDTMIYDAWGNSVAGIGTSEAPFLWIGERGYYHDPATGFYYVRIRPMEPRTGRWQSVDPLWAETEGRYIYAHNAPLIHVDPSGLKILWAVDQTEQCEGCAACKGNGDHCRFAISGWTGIGVFAERHPFFPADPASNTFIAVAGSVCTHRKDFGNCEGDLDRTPIDPNPAKNSYIEFEAVGTKCRVTQSQFNAAGELTTKFADAVCNRCVVRLPSEGGEIDNPSTDPTPGRLDPAYQARGEGWSTQCTGWRRGTDCPKLVRLSFMVQIGYTCKCKEDGTENKGQIQTGHRFVNGEPG